MMTPLEAHDLKIAQGKAKSRQMRIDLLLELIRKIAPPLMAREIIAEYRVRAKGLY